jgi:CheY-like chemotaxis protein
MGKKILLVEDEKELRALYREELKEEGYEIMPAKDGDEALQKLEKFHPDLVLLDIVLPGLDGIQTLSMIKAKDRSIPVILFSSHLQFQLDPKAQAANGFVRKTSDLRELQEKIQEVLG